MMPSRGTTDLGVVQRWLLSVITDPEGVSAGIESAAAQRECAVLVDQVESIVCRSQAQSSLERLAVYSNAYRSRLLDVLMGEYPALVHAVGEDIFIALAAGYLDDHPPQSYTLSELGQQFPDHLARTRPARENPDSTPDWADFLIDLARLERTYSEVFDGPGMEGEQALRPEQVQSLTSDQWLSARLIPVPCLRLLTFHFPVHEYASAVRRNEQPDLPESTITYLGITRRDYIVRRASLDEQEFRVLRELIEGRTIAQALENAMQAHRGSIDELANRLNVWFRQWNAAGYFVELR